MSYIDGDEAVKQVREYERSRGLHTPIIAISAHLEDGLSSDLLSLFEGVLTKPVALPELDVYLDQLSADRKDEKMTKLIDIEDLRGRTAGKVKLMIMVLDSFMTSARTQLLTLQPTLRESDSQLLLRTLHTVKGLLLEAGAAMSAEKVARYERDLHKGTPISDASLDEIKYLVLQVVEEAARIKDDLSCSQ
jgi:hypothetical protein